MFDGEPVPNKLHYTYDAPEIDARTARGYLDDELHVATRTGIERAYEALEEYIENCDHDHVVTTGRKLGDVAYCEDCGRGWEGPEFDYDRDHGNLNVVGSVS